MNTNMNNWKDTFINFFKNEDIKKDVRQVIQPIFSLIYNEIYLYVWIICLYNVFFIFIILAMFFLILKILHNQKIKYNDII